MQEDETAIKEKQKHQECQEEETPIPLETKYSRKKALLEFRCRVEDAILSNYILGEDKEGISSRKSEKAKENLRELTLWGVPLLPSKGHEASDVVLMKFLKAKDFKVSEAFKMLKNTLKWRREMEIDGILDENLSPDLEKMGFVGGEDNKGHPLCYNMFEIYKNKEIPKEIFATEEFIRWNMQFMERCIQTVGFKAGGANSVTRIIDLKNVPAPAMELLFFNKKISTLFQENYPGIICRNIVINVPLWLLAFHAWRLRLLTQRAKSKFIFVRSHRVTETLLKYITPENLPIQYGGLKRENDQEFSCHDKVVQLKIKANTTENIKILVDQVGVTVYWDMTVVGYEVSYKEEFIPDDDCSYRILLQDEKKMKNGVRNSFYVREPGKIVLSIVNSTLKNKKVFHRHSIKPTLINLTFLTKY